MYPHPIFSSYAYPGPPGFSEARVRPEAARWDAVLSEFALPYEVMRTAVAPREDLMEFLETTYSVAADLGGWNREQLEWKEGERPPVGGLKRQV